MSQQINLYDPALRAKREWLAAGPVAGAVGVLLAVVIAWGGWLRLEGSRLQTEADALAPQVKALQEQVAALGRQMADRKPDVRLEQELSALRSQLAVRGEVLAVLDKGLGADAPVFSDYLRGLARQAPGGLWLTGFSLDGDAMEIRGRTLDPALLPGYIKRLNGEKVFQGRAFAALKMSAGTVAPVAAPAGQPAPATSGPVGTPPREAVFHEFALVPARVQGEAP